VQVTFSPPGGRSLNPAASLAFVAWLFAALALDRLAEAGVAAVLLAAYTGSLLRLYAVYLWVAAPTFLVVWATSDLSTAAITTYRVEVLVVGTSSALLGVRPLELAWLLSRPPLPPIAGFFIPFAVRAADFLLQSVQETVAALRGRGVSGRLGLILRAPVPLAVFAFNASAYLAEALHFKYPRRGRKWLQKPKLKACDYAVFAFVAAHLAYLLLLA